MQPLPAKNTANSAKFAPASPKTTDFWQFSGRLPGRSRIQAKTASGVQTPA
jgi:hypothetical protein